MRQSAEGTTIHTFQALTKPRFGPALQSRLRMMVNGCGETEFQDTERRNYRLFQIA
jgi:hypothetical protein